MNKILWDFEKQTGHQILAKRLNLVIINKNKQTNKKTKTKKESKERKLGPIVDFENQRKGKKR